MGVSSRSVRATSRPTGDGQRAPIGCVQTICINVFERQSASLIEMAPQEVSAYRDPYFSPESSCSPKSSVSGQAHECQNQ